MPGELPPIDTILGISFEEELARLRKQLEEATRNIATYTKASAENLRLAAEDTAASAVQTANNAKVKIEAMMKAITGSNQLDPSAGEDS